MGKRDWAEGNTHLIGSAGEDNSEMADVFGILAVSFLTAAAIIHVGQFARWVWQKKVKKI